MNDIALKMSLNLGMKNFGSASAISINSIIASDNTISSSSVLAERMT